MQRKWAWQQVGPYWVQEEGGTGIEVEHNGGNVKESIVTQTGDGVDRFPNHRLFRVTEPLDKKGGGKGEEGRGRGGEGG